MKTMILKTSLLTLSTLLLSACGGFGGRCDPLIEATKKTAAAERSAMFMVSDPEGPLPDAFVIHIGKRAWSNHPMVGYTHEDRSVGGGRISLGLEADGQCDAVGTGTLRGRKVKTYSFQHPAFKGENDAPWRLHVDSATGRVAYQESGGESGGGFLWLYDDEVKPPEKSRSMAEVEAGMEKSMENMFKAR